MLQAYEVDAYITIGTTAICIDQFIYEKRQGRCRFSFAHETGHAVLHQNVLRQLSFDSTEEWKRVQAEIDDSSFRRLEYQANTFASFVLMPADVLRDRFTVATGRVDEEARKMARISSKFRREIVIGILSREFVVSEAAMRRRLEKTDL